MPLDAQGVRTMAGGAAVTIMGLPTAPALVLSDLLQQPRIWSPNGRYRACWLKGSYMPLLQAISPSHLVAGRMGPN